MNPTAIITLSSRGATLATAIDKQIGPCDLYAHQDVTTLPGAQTFQRVIALTSEIFTRYSGLVYIMPTGVVVRAIGPLVEHKTTDPAIVAVDVGGRWAISLLSGHEGGANDLANNVANVLDGEPIISTTTEAEKQIIAGLGCRRTTTATEIIDALTHATRTAGVELSQLRLIATAELKKDEEGLIQAANQLQVPLRFIPHESLRNCNQKFEPSPFVQEKVNLPAVAEPSALIAGVRTTLLLPKQKYTNVTVALAREYCMWSE